MSYVSGQTLSSRLRRSFSYLVKMFWEAVEFVGYYFTTIVEIDRWGKIVPGSSRFPDDGDPPGGRRMGRIYYRGGPDPPPMG
ncbi:unnamed protein product [Boreogadus saida]